MDNKVAISIPDDVFEQAEKIIHEAGVSRSKLYTAAIVDFVKAHADRKTTEKFNQVYAQENSKLDKQMAALQKKKLRETE